MLPRLTLLRACLATQKGLQSRHLLLRAQRFELELGILERSANREGEGQFAVPWYLSEPIARRMMADNPELRKQFEAKLAGDAQFAADPRARLQWWFQQSKYEAGDAGRYPIARVWEKNW